MKPITLRYDAPCLAISHRTVARTVASVGLLACIAGAGLAHAETAQATREAPGPDALSLAEAHRLALEQHPTLAASALSVRAQEALGAQAGRWRNPDLSVQVENVVGSGVFEGTDLAETTVALSQPFELGGKPGKRRDVANRGANLKAVEHTLLERELRAQVTAAFVEALGAQRRLELAEELLRDTGESAAQIERDAAAGRAPAVDASRARVEVSRAHVARDRSRGRLAAAHVRLRATLGSEENETRPLVGELSRVIDPPSLDALLDAVHDAPALARWEQQLDVNRAALRLERSRLAPDVTLSAGYRRLSASDDNMAVFGVALPIPLFDRNRDKVAAAGFELQRASAGLREARLRLRAEISLAHERLSTTADEARHLTSNVLPEARRAFEKAKRSYAARQLSFLELIDTRRTLYRARTELLDDLEAYHRAVTQIERLVDLRVGPEL